MQYGRYYIDSMPTQDDTDDDYVVIYACDPNARDFDPARDEVASFTVVQAEKERCGAVYAYMRDHYPRQIGDRQGSLTCVDVIEPDIAVWEGVGLQYAEDLQTGVMTLTDSLSFLNMLVGIGRRKNKK